VAPHYGGDQPLKTLPADIRLPRSIKNKNNNERITSFRDRIYALSSSPTIRGRSVRKMYKSVRTADDNNNNDNIRRRGEIAAAPPRAYDIVYPFVLSNTRGAVENIIIIIRRTISPPSSQSVGERMKKKNKIITIRRRLLLRRVA